MELLSKKKTALKIILGVLLLAAFVTCSFFWVRYIKAVKAHHVEPLTEETLLTKNLMSCNKLMIVAHPDDDAIWGGAHLKEGGYLVVCITNNRNETRKQEFFDAVDASGNTPLILGYPDKVNGKRDDWDKVYSKITDDISYIMGYKEWDMIVTHNPDGEYGHIHHKMTSEITTKVYNRLKPAAKLYYFGKYYKASQIDSVKDSLTAISEEDMEFKDKLLEHYESQSETIEKFRHMLPYEEWTEYTPN